MPLYEYQCKKCGHRFEKIQKFSDPLVKKCPKCRGTVEQMICAPAVQFKGTGWYVTDYPKKSSAGKDGGESESSAGKSESGGKTESGKTESSKTESKSGEKTESKSKPEPSGKKAPANK